MSLLDTVTQGAKDLMDDGKLNGTKGEMDLGAMVSGLGSDSQAKLQEIMGSLNFNIADLKDKIPTEKMGAVADMIKSGDWNGLKGVIGGLGK